MASSLFTRPAKQPQRNNPMQSIMQAMQSGQNPRDFVRAMAKDDPAWARVDQAIGQMNPGQVSQQLDRNARGQGSSLQQLIQFAVRQLGLPIKM